MKPTITIPLILVLTLLLAPGVLGVLANTIGAVQAPTTGTNAIKGTYNFSTNYNTTVTNGGGTVQNLTVFVGTTTACSLVIGNSTGVQTASCNYITTGVTDGTYTITFSLWLTNGTNEVNTTATSVVIDNTAPAAVLTVDFADVAATKLFTGDCSRSTDNLGTALNFSQVLTKPDTTTVTKTETSGISTFSETDTEQKGEYTLQCTVTDAASTTASQSATIRVKDKSTPPQVLMGKATSSQSKNNSQMFFILGGALLLAMFIGVFAIYLATSGKKK